MWQTLVNAFRDKDIRKKIFITFALLLVFRIGCYIPLPGLDINMLQSNVSENQLIGVLNMISGGSLENGTLFALGVLPYINSFIIMQLLTLIIPPLERMSKQGDEGRKKITQITRYVAIVLAIIQSIGIIVSYNSSQAIVPTLGSKWVSYIVVALLLTSGSAFVMWLAERITEHGITNGSSMIIFVGIIATFGNSLINAFRTVPANLNNLWYIFGYLLLVVVLFCFIVFIDGAARNIPVSYAGQVKGNKIYNRQTSNIPIKVNGSGVMPIIFASSFLMFPQIIVSFFDGTSFAIFYNRYLGVGSAVYYVFMFLFIIFFSYFYAQIQFNPIDVARNLQQYGGTIRGVRPGKPTSEYLARINNRITLFGALFLAFIAIIPTFLFGLLGRSIGMNNAFSATSMLIVVSVALELNKQLESQIMMRHYRGFWK